jgi:hypothetical protein
VVDGVGAAMGLQKNLMASSELESTPSGDYHALTCKHGSTCSGCYTRTRVTTSHLRRSDVLSAVLEANRVFK